MNKKERTLVPVLRVALVGMAVFTLSPQGLAQAGWNAAVESTSGTVMPAPSYALLDATQFTGTGSDMCSMINNTLGSVAGNASLNGVVVDARGVPSSNLDCTGTGQNPWASVISNNSPASNTVLLPAGTIKISQSWILPNNTHLVGEGAGLTTITVAKGMSGDMLDMGSELISVNLPCFQTIQDCPSIVIEHLGLVGNGTVNGIVNCCGQEFSRVNDVSISSVNIGLNISDKYTENSGPYTNLSMTSVNTCLSIGPGTTAPIPDTRGVHGLKCSVTTLNSAAITIDAPNNSLEDISISGSSTQDGILIGSQGAAQSNVLFNISGSGLKNVIHISGNSPSPPGASNCPNATNYVCDVTIMGVSHSSGNNSILDELVPSSTIADAYVGMYVVGEVQNGIGYTRMTTSTSIPTWLVGTLAPSNASCSIGDLYSCTGSASQCTANSTTKTLWECVGGTSHWKGIQ